MSSPKQIVIVGGGYVGIQFAQDLAKLVPASLVSITVIEKNEFSFHVIGLPRAFVDPSYVPKLFLPLAHALPASHTKLIRAVADSIAGNEVRVRKIGDNHRPDEATTPIPFDYLVLATGSRSTLPFKVSNHAYTRENVENAVVELAAAVKAAASVLIVGAGPVGLEVAGEIASAYPDKTITIVDANPKLVAHAGLTDKFRASLAAKLAALQIRVVLGERIVARLTGHGFERQTVATDKGTQLESDVQLLCVGMTPNVDLIKALDPALVDDVRGIKVTTAMQLDDPRFTNIFAIGDVSNHPTSKLAFTGALQGKHLAKQLAKLIKKGDGQVDPFLATGPGAMILPLGPSGGVAQLPFFGGVVAGDMVVRAAKAKDYFAGKFWATWHAQIPN
ncbi:Aste57867_10066 [Aphanomyces stellatus]|uniref:Aste57867_10066 protein n=1 Tax=Aphanomyces stellatus TaxID=120398 RepID=A0A485KPW5_9STRA|nr:hypothetical protein As57867_010027 [Aphanomyces stellatus]VFT86942.1 Aste57867_10066 [Aphanomyces stellatus]